MPDAGLTRPGIPRQDFDALARQTGVALSMEQQDELYRVYGLLEGMVARLHRPLPREADIAAVFRPGSAV